MTQKRIVFSGLNLLDSIEEGTQVTESFLLIKGWVLYESMSGLWKPFRYEITPAISVLVGRSIGLPVYMIVAEFSDGEIHTDIGEAIPDSDYALIKGLEQTYGPAPVIPSPIPLLCFYNVETARKDGIRFLAVNMGLREYVYLYHEP